MINSVFADSGWIAFIEKKHGLQHRILTAGKEGPDTAWAKLLVFVNSRGKLRTPPLMPFMPIQIQQAQTPSPTKRQSQWLQLGGELAEQMNELGYGGAISLDPQITDVRPWQWRGMTAEVRYTYILPPSETLQNLSASKRKSLRKTEKLGYSAGPSKDTEAVLHCLQQSEQRQNFETGLTADDLNFLENHVTPGAYRTYLVRDASGAPVSSRVALCLPGFDAIGLAAGTVSEHLRNGAAQLSILATLEDLVAQDVQRFDFGGANIESVATAKMQWGGELTPFTTLTALSARSLALQGKRWLNKRIREVRG